MPKLQNTPKNTPPLPISCNFLVDPPISHNTCWHQGWVERAFQSCWSHGQRFLSLLTPCCDPHYLKCGQFHVQSWLFIINVLQGYDVTLPQHNLCIRVGLRRLGPLHTRNGRPVTISLQALSLVGKVEPVQVRFTLCLRDQWSTWMQDRCKVYMDSYVALNGSCFMVTWIVFMIHLLEEGLTQNREIVALWNFTTVGLLYFITCEDPEWIKIHWNSIWLRARFHMIAHYTWGPVTPPLTLTI